MANTASNQVLGQGRGIIVVKDVAGALSVRSTNGRDLRGNPRVKAALLGVEGVGRALGVREHGGAFFCDVSGTIPTAYTPQRDFYLQLAGAIVIAVANALGDGSAQDGAAAE